MRVSNRQRQIIEVLLSKEDEITAGEIAAQIKVSTRTVHRELAEIESVLASAGISLLKKSGIGIQLSAGAEALTAFTRELAKVDSDHYTADERKTLMLCWLLDSSEPVKLFSLSQDLHVAVPTVTADLDEIELWVAKMGLDLVRRRGFGVQIIGPEAAARNTIARAARDHLDDSELFGLTDDQSADPVARQLLAMIGKSGGGTFFAVEKALWQLEDKWPTKLPEASYTMLLIRLSVALTRLRQGRTIPTGPLSGGNERIRPDENSKLDYFLNALHLSFTLPPEEIAYLAREFVLWDGPQQLHTELLPGNLQFVDRVVRLIRFVDNRMNEQLLRDRSLLDGLVRHLEPALERIRDGVAIRNPILAQIKKDYGRLFDVVRLAVNETIDDLSVPDEEIGFLVMHFGASLERMKQFSRNVRALLVCTSGIGSSKLLAVRIGKELPQIDLKGHVSWFEASRIPEDEYDLIISTVDLPVEADRYIKLSPLLTKEEAEKLRTFIQTITLKRLPPENKAVNRECAPLERMQSIATYANDIVMLIERFDIFREDIYPDEADLKGILLRLCARAGQQGGLARIEPVAMQLIDRESHGSQIIPDTELALFHTRSEYVLHPILTLFRLDVPLYLGEDNQSKVFHILLMLAPKELSKERLEILSEISGMLLSDDLIKLLETGSKQSIREYLSRELEIFLQTKTGMERVTDEHFIQRQSEIEREGG
jgi:mannitol operon transcriptional antiterminator